MKLCVTDAAAISWRLPAWLAVIVHVPVAMSVTTSPKMVQTAGVRDVKVTSRPEAAVAIRGNGGAPRAMFDSAANAIVCEPGPIMEFRVTEKRPYSSHFPPDWRRWYRRRRPPRRRCSPTPYRRRGWLTST